MDFSAAPIRTTVYLGESGSPLDISQNIKEYSPIASSSLETTGVIKVETSITLNNSTGLNLETRFNTRWARGNKVTIEVRNAADTAWILHRTLYILKNKYDDGRRPQGAVSPSLSLNLGCKIALLDSNYQSQASYKVPILSAEPYVLFRTLLAFWLDYFKFPALVLVSGDYAGNPQIIYSLPYTPGSSAAEHIGRVVYAYTGGYWWIDAGNNSRIAAPTLTPTTATFVYDGPDCALNARSGNESEKPAGLVRVFGVSNFVTAYTDPPVTPTSATTGNVTETSTFEVITAPLTRTTIKAGTQTISGAGTSGGGTGGGSGATGVQIGTLGQFKETTLEEFTGGFGSQPNPIPGQPNIPGSPPWLNRVTVTVEEQRQEAPSGGGGGGFSLGGLAKTKEVVTDYFYRQTQTTVQGVTVTGIEVRKTVVTTKILPGGTIGGFDANALVDEVVTEDWVKLGRDQYRYSKTVIRPNDIENRRDLNAGSAAQNSPPPATQFAPTQIRTQTVDHYGQSQFEYPPTAIDALPTPRDFNFDFYLPSNARAGAIAQYEGALIIGRAEAQDLAFAPTDAWLADPRPAPVAFIRDDPADTDDQVYLMDAVSLLCGLRQQYVFGTGIWLGVRDRVSGVITAPYDLTFDYLTNEAGDILTDEQGNLLYNA
jgi:hypothetical protein